MSSEDQQRDKNETSPETALYQMIRGHGVTQLIYVAAKLGIADLLGNGARSVDTLATSAGAHPRSLYRVLRALASLGIFAERDGRRFELTPLAEPLRSGVPGSLRNSAIMTGEEWFWRPYGQLLHSVRTGETAFNHVFGMGLFDYLESNSEAAKIFNNSMTGSTKNYADSVVSAYDFSGITTIVDVGGGHGSFLAAILKAEPSMRGVLFEQPSALDGARGLLEAEGVADRCELIAGDFFQSVPDDADAYILKWIIHDWDDDEAIGILRNCRRAMAPAGRLLLVEREAPPPGESSSGTLLGDITMMVIPGGLERTRGEYGALFESAGFRLSRVVPTESELSIFEGAPA